MPKEKSDVGGETKADMKGALEGKPEDKPVISGGKHGKSIVGGTGLGGAVSELHEQHPHKYDDLGPHHDTSDHVRHEPMHGLKR